MSYYASSFSITVDSKHKTNITKSGWKYFDTGETLLTYIAIVVLLLSAMIIPHRVFRPVARYTLRIGAHVGDQSLRFVCGSAIVVPFQPNPRR